VLEQLEALYKIELALSYMWFDLFRRFPMTEDSGFYYMEALFYAQGASSTFRELGELADLLVSFEKEYGKEALDQINKLA